MQLHDGAVLLIKQPLELPELVLLKRHCANIEPSALARGGARMAAPSLRAEGARSLSAASA